MSDYVEHTTPTKFLKLSTDEKLELLLYYQYTYENNEPDQIDDATFDTLVKLYENTSGLNSASLKKWSIKFGYSDYVGARLGQKESAINTGLRLVSSFDNAEWKTGVWTNGYFKNGTFVVF
jgi:hypothetical protein